MKTGDNVYVNHYSLGYEGDDADIIGYGVLISNSANGRVWVRMDTPINCFRDFHVPVHSVKVID